MSRTFPYEDAAVYLAWKSLRGQRYARGMFEGVSSQTFWDWEKRYDKDKRLQEMTERKKVDLGLAELRQDTVGYLRWAYDETKAFSEYVQQETDPKKAAALAEFVKAMATMSKVANDVYVDTDPLPLPPDAHGS